MTPHEWTAIAVFLNSICICWWAWRMYRIERRIAGCEDAVLELYQTVAVNYNQEKNRGIQNGSSSKN